MRKLGILQKFEVMGHGYKLDREGSEDQRIYIHSFTNILSSYYTEGTLLGPEMVTEKGRAPTFMDFKI